MLLITACLADVVVVTDGGSDDKNKGQLPISEELQQINDELEKEHVFALKKVKCLRYCRQSLSMHIIML